MAKRFDLWNGYKELNRFVYSELKKRYPNLIIFPTIQYEHMLGIHEASRTLADWLKSDYPDVLWKEVYELLTYSDALALSTFPYLSYGNKIYPGYYDHALNLANALNKPIAIDQMGYLSQDVYVDSIILSGSEIDQSNVVYYLLLLALQHKFLFAINFFSTDYGENYGTDPIATSWAYTGLLDTTGNYKPALGVWDLFFSIPYSVSN